MVCLPDSAALARVADRVREAAVPADLQVGERRNRGIDIKGTCSATGHQLRVEAMLNHGLQRGLTALFEFFSCKV